MFHTTDIYIAYTDQLKINVFGAVLTVEFINYKCKGRCHTSNDEESGTLKQINSIVSEMHFK